MFHAVKLKMRIISFLLVEIILLNFHLKITFLIPFFYLFLLLFTNFETCRFDKSMNVLCDLIPSVLILVNLIPFNHVAWQLIKKTERGTSNLYKNIFQSSWFIQWNMFKLIERDNWIQNSKLVYNLKKYSCNF